MIIKPGIEPVLVAIYQYRPSITCRSYRSFDSKSWKCKLNRVLLGHARLKSHLQEVGIEDSNIYDCGEGIDDRPIEHVPLHCQLYNNQRDILESSIYSIDHRYDTLFSTINDLAFIPSFLQTCPSR